MRVKAALTCLALLALTGCVTQANSPAASQAATTDATFRGTKADVIRLAINAVQAKGWSLGQVNESVGTVSFETAMSIGSWSGISATLIIAEVSPNTYRVTGTAKQNVRGGQVAALDLGGEAQGVVKEAIASMRSLEAR